MIYASVCSGIEGASVAWGHLGWTSAFFSEVDPFASDVLRYHFPHVANVGDFTRIDRVTTPIDILIGGTPCQDFSVAGLKAGLAGKRGQLTIEFVRLIARLQPRYVIWENVPGVLSNDGGRAFGTFLGALADIGYGFAYRILDAQYAGVPQRRRRVFVVGCAGGSYQRAAAILFDIECLRRDLKPSIAPQTITSALTTNGVGGGGGPDDNAAQANHLVAAPIAFGCKQDGNDASHISPTLRAMNYNVSNANGGGQIAIARPIAFGYAPKIAHTLRAEGFDASEDGTGRGTPIVVNSSNEVRRLTPRECERLQGFPDDWTLIPVRKGKRTILAADAPRYRAIGNSFAVPVIRILGDRIAMVDQIDGDS